MFFAPHPLASDCWPKQRYTRFLSRRVSQAVRVGVRAFLHAPILGSFANSAPPLKPMSKKPVPGNPASAQPMPGLSLKAQALLKPARNQIVLAAKGQADKTRSILKGGI